MVVAVVLATTPATRLLCLEGTLVDRLSRQLSALGAQRIHIVTRPVERRAVPSRPALAPLETTAADTSAVETAADPSAVEVRPVDLSSGEETVVDLPPIEAVSLPPIGSTARADGARSSVIRSSGFTGDLRAVAAIARAGTGPVAVLPGDLVAHTEALALLLADPGRGTGALISPGHDLPSNGGGPAQATGGGPIPFNGGGPAPATGGGPVSAGAPVRAERGKVIAAGNSFHTVAGPNGAFRGVLHVGEADLPRFAEVADELADLARDRRLGGADEAEVAELLLAGLVRVGVAVRAVPLGRLHCARMAGQQGADAAMARLAEVDEDHARLAAAIKSEDGFVATYLVSSWSGHVVRMAARLGLTPNAVTGLSVGLAALAAVAFSAGERRAQLAGAVLLYLSFVLDCVDGQLARYTRMFSPLGAWLDATFDRVKEYLVYVGLALGYAGGVERGAMGPDGIWALAVAAMLVQAIRHMIDFSYAGARADASGDGGGPVVRLSARLDRNTALRWLKKVIVLPIGERMVLIAVTAGLFNARVTFLALLAWGGVAALYTLTGRTARSL